MTGLCLFVWPFSIQPLCCFQAAQQQSSGSWLMFSLHAKISVLQLFKWRRKPVHWPNLGVSTKWSSWRVQGLLQQKNIITPPDPHLQNLFITGTFWDRSQDTKIRFSNRRDVMWLWVIWEMRLQPGPDLKRPTLKQNQTWSWNSESWHDTSVTASFLMFCRF